MAALKPLGSKTKPAATLKPKGNGSARRFVYEDTPDEVMQQHATAKSGARDSYTGAGFQSFKYREGENIIRVLPRTFNVEALRKEGWRNAQGGPLDPHWALPIWLHYGIGPDNSGFLCSAKMLGKDCILCDERFKASDQETKDELAPKLRYLTWEIDRSNEKQGPILWAMPPAKVEKEICLRAGKTKPPLKLTNPDEGFDISFMVVKQGDFPNYSGIDISRQASPISDDPDTVEKWLAYIAEHPLNSVLVWYEPDYIAKVRGGEVEAVATAEAGAEADAGTEVATEGERPSEAEIAEMDGDDLATTAAAFGFELSPSDFESLDDARAAVVEALYPAEETEPEPEPQPASKPAAKPATKPAAKPAAAKPAAKPVAAVASETSAERIKRLREKIRSSAAAS